MDDLTAEILSALNVLQSGLQAAERRLADDPAAHTDQIMQSELVRLRDEEARLRRVLAAHLAAELRLH